MDNKPLIFQFVGKIEISERFNNGDLEAAIRNINDREAFITATLEQEIKKVVPMYNPYVDISFSKGSILFIGTIALTTWNLLQPIIAKSLENSLEPELTSLMKIAISRTIKEFTGPRTLGSSRDGITDIIPPGSLELEVKPLHQNSNLVITPQEKDMGVVSNPEPDKTTYIQKTPRYLITLTIFNFVLVIILIILMLIPHIHIV